MPLDTRLKDPDNVNIDVVVCVKNQAKALNRVLRQISLEVPFKDLIVIYGTSVDETRKIARKFTDKVFWDGDRGLGAARNLGMRKATSEIVAMIDSDVILSGEWYRKLISHFNTGQVAAAMGTCIFGYGCLPIERFWKNQLERLERSGYGNWGCHNVMFRRDIVLGVGNFDETIRGAGEDLDLYWRLLDAGYKWVWDKEVVVHHPFNMGEFLSHWRWWAQSPPIVRKQLHKLKTKSLSGYYRERIWDILQAFTGGISLSIRVHPTMLLYYPLLKIVEIMTLLDEVKKWRFQNSKSTRIYMVTEKSLT